MNDQEELGHAVASARRVPFRIALRHPVRSVTHRQGWLIRGPHGWGEFSPMPGSSPEVMTRCLRSAWEAASTPPPPQLRREIPVNALIPEVDAETARSLTIASGCSTAKVKVGPSPHDASDRERLEAVRDALGPAGSLRIDVNGGWDVDTAVRWVDQNRDLDLELIEQPVRTLEELADLRRRIDIPVAADEAVSTLEDARLLHSLRAADALVIKLQPVGGYQQASRIIDAAGVPAIVSSPIETAIGTMSSARLAASLDPLPYACGLASGQLLSMDVAPLETHEGTLVVTDLEIDEEALLAVRFTA